MTTTAKTPRRTAIIAKKPAKYLNPMMDNRRIQWSSTQLVARNPPFRNRLPRKGPPPNRNYEQRQHCHLLFECTQYIQRKQHINTTSIFNSPTITKSHWGLLQLRKKIGAFTTFYDFSYSTTPPPQRLLWRLKKLADDDILGTYRNHFKVVMATLSASLQQHLSQTGPPNNHTILIEGWNNDLCQLIYESLDNSVGRKQSTEGHNNQHFWTAEMLAAIDHREHHYTKWRRATGLSKMAHWIRHQRAKAILRRLTNQRKQLLWRIFCDNMASGDYTKATRKMKKMKSGRTVSPRYSHVDGPQAAVDSMAHHLTTIYSGSIINNDRPAPITTATTTTLAPPFTTDEVLDQLLQLPRSKAPGIDSITTEILRPISDLVSPIISTLFTICWNWGYTPEAWRTAQVISIYKKGTATDPANYRPISLTSIFRKLMEKCIHGTLLAHSPPLDVAQGGFRAQRSALDQALCLAQICHIYTKINKAPPVLAFLDIKSAYDTVERTIIWDHLRGTTPTKLLHLLKNLFDDVSIIVMQQNFQAPAFSPATGVLQGSILSPLLYSIYINSLPQLLRTSPPSLPTTPSELLTSYTCLLYADDVALIGDKRTILTNLQLCEQHSFDLGYRWSPTKCVILDPAPSPSSFQLYNTSIPCHDHFTYLGIPFKTGGEIDRDRLLQHNTQKMLASMNVMTSLGLNNSGFTKLLSSRIYQQFLRPQMEYGLAITPLTKTLVTKKLEQAQNDSIRRFYGAHSLSSTVIMRHLAKIPSMQARVDLLRFKYLHRIATLPADSLLSIIIAVSTRAPRRFTAISPWIRLSNHPLWCQYKSLDDPPPTQRFLNAHLETLHTAASSQSTLLQQCRPKRGIDPILHVPMDRRHRSRLIRWRLGWLTGGSPKLCACGQTISKRHIISCLRLHARLSVGTEHVDPLSFLINRLPRQPTSQATTRKWRRYWPILTAILLALEQLQHPDHQEPSPPPEDSFMAWLQSVDISLDLPPPP